MDIVSLVVVVVDFVEAFLEDLLKLFFEVTKLSLFRLLVIFPSGSREVVPDLGALPVVVVVSLVLVGWLRVATLVVALRDFIMADGPQC
jgi:uncharacterized membrane protein